MHRCGWKILKSAGLGCLLVCVTPVARGGTFALPLTQTNGWQFLKYRHIPPNTFRCSPAGLVIGVSNSAAPAVFPLTNAIRMTELRVRGKISGSLKVPPAKQGEKGLDDFTLRLGLVEPGTRTLNWWQNVVAADWVRQLVSLAPPGAGIGKIHFFNLGTAASQIGRSWTYDFNVPMEQTVAAAPDANRRFAFTYRLTKPLPVIAIWISSDGDDTQSSFTVTLNQIAFQVPGSMKYHNQRE